MVPFKYKTIITKYIKDEVDYDTTLESHLYHMDPECFDYKIYKQLRSRIRVSQYKDPLNKEKGFKEKVYTIEQLSGIDTEKKESMGIIVRELIISKLAMFGFSV